MDIQVSMELSPEGKEALLKLCREQPTPALQINGIEYQVSELYRNEHSIKVVVEVESDRPSSTAEYPIA